MISAKNNRVEFGDFQTPYDLAVVVCKRLAEMGLAPRVVIEPTCGVGAFVKAAANAFLDAESIRGYEINAAYLEVLKSELEGHPANGKIRLSNADFFTTNWDAELEGLGGSVLVIGNFPWVTNSTQGSIGGTNLPGKSNFLGFSGFDAISGKSNFDISEWMLIVVLALLSKSGGSLAMLVKTAVARKVLSHAERQKQPVIRSTIAKIDAKKHFNASVDACLLVIEFDPAAPASYDYIIYESLDDLVGRKVGHRQGMTVSDLDSFAASEFLLGKSPQKWRSGVKHDASAVMEFTRCEGGYVNGLGEVVQLEDNYLYPLLKGSDIGSGKNWREKFVLVTQRVVGEETASIRDKAPKTWAYLVAHSEQLDARGSTIYAKNPKFSIFGIGDYAFRPWRIAICGLYKHLRFRLVPPMAGRPVMFDDTAYYISFETEEEARKALAAIESTHAMGLLASLVFWDEKRPIKTSILNVLDWSKV